MLATEGTAQVVPGLHVPLIRVHREPLHGDWDEVAEGESQGQTQRDRGERGDRRVAGSSITSDGSEEGHAVPQSNKRTAHTQLPLCPAVHPLLTA